MTEDNIEEFRSINMPLFIAFVAKDDQLSSELFHSFANEYQDRCLFGISYDLNLAIMAPVKPPFIILYNPLDHVDRTLRGPFQRFHFNHFLDDVANPLIGNFPVETYYTYTQVGSL